MEKWLAFSCVLLPSVACGPGLRKVSKRRVCKSELGNSCEWERTTGVNSSDARKTATTMTTIFELSIWRDNTTGCPLYPCYTLLRRRQGSSSFSGWNLRKKFLLMNAFARKRIMQERLYKRANSAFIIYNVDIIKKKKYSPIVTQTSKWNASKLRFIFYPCS